MTFKYNYAGGQNELVSYSKLANLEITKRHQEPPDGDQRKGEPDRQEAHRIHGRRCIEILAQDRQAAASETRVHAPLVRCAATGPVLVKIIRKQRQAHLDCLV